MTDENTAVIVEVQYPCGCSVEHGLFSVKPECAEHMEWIRQMTGGGGINPPATSSRNRRAAKRERLRVFPNLFSHCAEKCKCHGDQHLNRPL